MRKLIIGFVGAYLSALTVLVLMLHNASPGPTGQDILGVGIGSYDDDRGIVYLSGRRLHCRAPTSDVSFTSYCTVAIAGKQLEIRARRNPTSDFMQLGGSCEAHFDGRRWPCEIGSRHITTHWFAYIHEPLGLSKPELDLLSRRYFFENLPELPFFIGILVVPSITAVSIMCITIIEFQRRVASNITRIGITIISGTVTFVSLFILAVKVTYGFWD
jgi:hypothetical protein